MTASRPWELPGPEHGLVREVDRALRRLHTCERRPPTQDDRPQLSTLPMTAGARAALELSRKRSS